ncbi:DNA-binding transcriptional regulator, XRE-family HTH domain [Thalassobacillus cyri]|uniref:DNA-binding transcriptional regulator, XRE-family HTH domain n=1 Tax=Thalassobacillus cyri TaxID=571932 RepID=A0A1H4BXI7_9BACI|nr:helix-turn-helix domain-containing protein [Thalassobacillus cyri]SEA52799.1 DNA-binding transcriptional regulator, XRE-family HTH domain [Thalassobacillus cyri]
MLKDRLVKIRKEHKKTQQDMAKILGVTRPAYTAYERGSRKPDYDTLEKLADHFNVTTDYLLGRSDNPGKIESEDNDFDAMNEINNLLEKYGIEDSAFFDIEKWKAMGPEEIKELESYFDYITSKARKRKE